MPLYPFVTCNYQLNYPYLYGIYPPSYLPSFPNTQCSIRQIPAIRNEPSMEILSSTLPGNAPRVNQPSKEKPAKEKKKPG
jgi:hypothetical protein